jgi:hypothetical protein
VVQIGWWLGATLGLNDRADNDLGDRTLPNFRAACAYAASQGWLIVQDDTLTLTTAGFAAA